MPEPTPMPAPAAAKMMPPPGRPVPAPGATSPATVAPAQHGQRMRGYIGAAIAIKYLESLVPLFGAGAEEGQVVLKALTALSKKFGASASPDLQRQEVKLLGEQAAPAGPVTGQQGPALQDAIRQRLAAQGLGGAAPSPTPAGAGT